MTSRIRATSTSLAGDPERDVGRERVVEQEHVLRHHAELRVPAGEVVGDRPAADLDGALRGLEQAEDDVEQGALAGAARADERGRAVLGDVEREPAQHVFIRVGVLEAQLAQHDVS